MNIAIIGYGKMGKAIASIAKERNHQISLIIDIDNQQDLNEKNLSKCDVAIDFSLPTSAYDNIIMCLNTGTPIVSGTTGWLNKYDEVIDMCKQKDGTFFYASNYSLGVNLFFSLNKKLATMMKRFWQYEVTMEETHHTQKLDAPSGTAITLAEDLLKINDKKTNWELDEGQTDPSTLKIKAHRIENVPGIHEVRYDSEEDYIEIKHSAKSRKGFAFGAVLAAEYIKDKKGVFGMNDVLGLD